MPGFGWLLSHSGAPLPFRDLVVFSAFAVVLGIVVDHALRWWHKYLEKKDLAREAAASTEVTAVDPAEKAIAGVDPETPTWGNMLRDGQRLLSRAWWIAVFPGCTLFLTVLALNVLGDGIRDVLDPRLAHLPRRRRGRRSRGA